MIISNPEPKCIILWGRLEEILLLIEEKKKEQTRRNHRMKI